MHADDQPEIIAQSDDWLVINKPGGWHSVRLSRAAADLEGHGGGDPVLQDWLALRHAELAVLPECGLVQRLDQATSGCVIAGRSLDAIARLREAVTGRWGSIAKTYLAWVQGRCDDGAFDLYFHARHRRSRKVMVRTFGETHERGSCRWTVAETGRDCTLLEVELLGPGRRHQIRAGLAHLGHPLLGDALYAGREWSGGFGLHAWRVVIDGRTVTSPPPSRWSE